MEDNAPWSSSIGAEKLLTALANIDSHNRCDTTRNESPSRAHNMHKLTSTLRPAGQWHTVKQTIYLFLSASPRGCRRCWLMLGAGSSAPVRIDRKGITCAARVQNAVRSTGPSIKVPAKAVDVVLRQALRQFHCWSAVRRPQSGASPGLSTVGQAGASQTEAPSL